MPSTRTRSVVLTLVYVAVFIPFFLAGYLGVDRFSEEPLEHSLYWRYACDVFSFCVFMPYVFHHPFRNSLLYLTLQWFFNPNKSILLSDPVLIKVARITLLVSCLAKVSARLDEWALNKWIWDVKKDPFMLFTLERKNWKWSKEIAVITGGSNGIGALVAKGLASKGVKVAVLDVQPLSEELEDVSNITYFKCDITSATEVNNVADLARITLGASPSILINNAGIGTKRDILEMSPDAVQQVFNINIVSHFYTLQAFLPDMLARKKGHIVTVASSATYATPRGMAHYCATKAGVLALHEGLNQELKHGYRCPEIKTTIVHPHWTRTKILGPFMEDLRRSGAKILEPQVVAEAILRQIFSGKSGHVFVPETNRRVLPLLRALPTWMNEWARDGRRAITRSE